MPTILMQQNNRQRAALFSFVPKTGGSALLKFFENAGAGIFLHTQNNPISAVLKCPTQHFHYEMLATIYDFEKLAFSFTIVRNPFDRAVSDYIWGYRDRTDPQKIPSFDQWLSFVIREYHGNPYVFDNHIRPQSHFTGPGIEKVYRYEDGLESIVLDIFARLDIDFDAKGQSDFVPRENTAEQLSATGLRAADVTMSDASKALIKTVYRSDFDKFYPDALAG